MNVTLRIAQANCVTEKDAMRLRKAIEELLEMAEVSIVLDWAEVKVCSNAFTNAAIGCLRDRYSAEVLNKRLKHINMAPVVQSALKKTYEAARRYYGADTQVDRNVNLRYNGDMMTEEMWQHVENVLLGMAGVFEVAGIRGAKLTALKIWEAIKSDNDLLEVVLRWMAHDWLSKVTKTYPFDIYEEFSNSLLGVGWDGETFPYTICLLADGVEGEVVVEVAAFRDSEGNWQAVELACLREDEG